MFLAVAFTIMTTVASEQSLTISQEDIEFLQQLELLEALDILKSPEMDAEVEHQEEQKK